MRRRFFGDDASTCWARNHLEKSLPGYKHVVADIRDEANRPRLDNRLPVRLDFSEEWALS